MMVGSLAVVFSSAGVARLWRRFGRGWYVACTFLTTAIAVVDPASASRIAPGLVRIGFGLWIVLGGAVVGFAGFVASREVAAG